MFDPNNLSTGNNRKLNYDYLWATYIPDRSPKFKIHGRRGQATSAVKYRNHWQGRGDAYVIEEGVKLYHRETAESLWVEVPLKHINDGKESVIKDE
jgi:hypothetical protein